jgi:hypothetical protein
LIKEERRRGRREKVTGFGKGRRIIERSYFRESTK